MISFVKNHFRPIVAVVLAVVIFWVGYSVGHRRAPVQVREVEKRVEVQKQTMVVQQKVDISELKQVLTQYAQQVQKDVSTRRVIVVNKDGSKTITEERTDKSKTDTEKASDTKDAAASTTTTQKTVEVTKTVTVEKTVDRLVLSKPNWLVGLQGGISLPHLIDGDAGPNYLPYIPRQTVLGLTVDRRLLGGLYGGAWANTRGEAGLGLRLAF